MIQQLFALYKKFEDNADKFTSKGIIPVSFMDVYRSQPYEPELYEYFDLPAVFVDYAMQGQGVRKPRLVTLTLHILTDKLPDVSNISEQKQAGANRFLYHLLIQGILEGKTLGKTTPLKFISENIIDEKVINYHTQTYEFEAYLGDMMQETETIWGEFERLNIFGSLKNRLK